LEGRDLKGLTPIPAIESADQVVHRHRQHAGHEHAGHDAIAHPGLDHLEECPQERVSRGQFLVECILMRRQELVGEVVVFVDDDVDWRGGAAET